MYSFPSLKPVYCSMYCSNCCFLTCIQVSQEAGKVVWYSHLFKNFPQFVVIHTVKGFSVVNEAKADFFWNSLAFSTIQRNFKKMFYHFIEMLIYNIRGHSCGEGNSNPFQYSCLENPMGREAWQAAVHGVARAGRDLVTKPPP